MASADNHILESRELQIRGVVVTRSDLRQLARIVDDAAPPVSERDIPRTRYELRAEGPRNYKSTSPELLNEQEGLFDRAWVYGFSALYFGGLNESRIEVDLSHSIAPSSNNRILIEGYDRRWVAGTMKQFEDLIAGMPTQGLPKEWQRALLVIVTMIGIAALGATIGLVIPLPVQLSRSDSVLLGAITGLVASPFIGQAMRRSIDRMWPDVEMQTAREHANVAARTRKKWWNVITIGVLPLVLTAITFAISAIAGL